DCNAVPDRFLHIFVFFFSSRRRHTRSKRDWSSDVCSSDLSIEQHLARLEAARAVMAALPDRDQLALGSLSGELDAHRWRIEVSRSEERRVGKEWRSGWAPDR